MKIRVVLVLMLFTAVAVLAGCAAKPDPTVMKHYRVETVSDGVTQFYLVTNPKGGATLSYAVNSGIPLIEVVDSEGYVLVFKDMNRNGTLDDWEDWRLDTKDRAADLAGQLTKEQIAGLMLFSAHERFIENGLTDAQKAYLSNDHLRNVLNAGKNNVEAAVIWNNQMQAYVESLGSKGIAVIPVNFSTDPRSTAGSGDQYMVEGMEISLWPSNLGIAATFNPEIAFAFGKISSEEYRKMGISTLLGPQIDLATEPRWLRVNGTFGESPKLSADMARAMIDGLQSSFTLSGEDIGWGMDSVNAMMKHFPGDGPGESGRESHTFAGKYAVYPGENFSEHLIPFDAGLSLNGKTKSVASVMSSYSVAIDKNGNSLMGERMGSAYNKDKMDLLRKDRNFAGVICTDWGVTTYDPNADFKGMAWGAENLTVAERHYMILRTGTDIFGGNNDTGPVIAAYDLWDQDFKAGKVDISADERFRQSAQAIVTLMFNAGLFENPFLIMHEAKETVASMDKVEAGFKAQLDSIVMVKNMDNTIKSADISKDYGDKVVYIPSTVTYNFRSVWTPASKTTGPTMDLKTAGTYFGEVVTDTPVKNKNGEIIGYKAPDLRHVDMVIIGMRSPNNGSNFSTTGYKDGKYYPLSLKYRPYTANGDNVRRTSISGDINADGTQENRSYFNQRSVIANEYDLDSFTDTVLAVRKVERDTGRKIPIIVAFKAAGPAIMSEFEADADAIVVGFSVSDKALFEIILGGQEPMGLLPLQFPADMDTVEAQAEDLPFDMIPYKDSVGNVYDFAYGLNYKGIITDERTQKYGVERLAD